MRKIVIILVLNLILGNSIYAQKIDTDSLLVQTNREISAGNYAKAIELASIGINAAPDYLDFYESRGRAYKLSGQPEKARLDLTHVIDRNPKYKDSFTQLIDLETQQKNSAAANAAIDKALANYPDDKGFAVQKLRVINLENDDEKTGLYLNELVQKYPNDQNLKKELEELNAKSVSDRIGINYNVTNFSRDEVGPWQLIGLQYIRERKKLTLIGRVNYADRQSLGQSIAHGVQFEFETYFPMTRKSYSYASIAYSPDVVFPKLRASYSYFRGFAHGWEADLGGRYTKTADDKDIYAGVLGVGKYVGPYWLNLRSYLNVDQHKVYPAFVATARYYFNTKYDYATIIGGYGTSPDERVTLGDLEQRLSLASYRLGVGYYKLFGDHYCAGTQLMFNRQEYVIDKFQTEVDLFLTLQYKF